MSYRPWYNENVDYQTNAKSYMDYLGRVNKFMKVLMEDYEIFQELILEEFKQFSLDNNQTIEEFQDRLDGIKQEMTDLFVEWVDDGTLEQIINHDVLGNKADKTFVDSEIERLEQKDVTILDDLEKVKTYDKAIINFSFDDGLRADTLTKLIFNEYGFKAGFGLITNYRFGDDRNNLNFYREAESEGHSILGHSASHINMQNAVPDSVAQHEINESARILKIHGFNIQGWVSPYSSINENLIPLLSEKYGYGYTKYLGDLPESNKGHHLKETDPFKMHRVSLFSNTVEDIKQSIDLAIEEKGLLNFYDHGIGNSNASSELKLREILTYCKEKVDQGNLRVLSPNNAMKAFFGIGSKQSIKYNLTGDLTPPLNEGIVNYNSDSKWMYSQHAMDEETFNDGSVIFENGASINKLTSVQKIIDLNPYDMTNVKNQNIHFAIDIQTVGNVDSSNAEFSLEARFRNSSNENLGDIIKPIKVGNKKGRYYLTVSPKNLNYVDNVLLLVRMNFPNGIAGSFRVELSDPVINIGTRESLKTETPSISGQHTTAMTIPHNEFTKLTFDEFETKGYVNFEDSTFTITEEGHYYVAATLGYANGVEGTRLILAIYKNGQNYASINVGASGERQQGVEVSSIVPCKIGDTIEIMGYQATYQAGGSGADQTTLVSPYTHFSAFLIK